MRVKSIQFKLAPPRIDGKVQQSLRNTEIMMFRDYLVFPVPARHEVVMYRPDVEICVEADEFERMITSSVSAERPNGSGDSVRSKRGAGAPRKEGVSGKSEG